MRVLVLAKEDHQSATPKPPTPEAMAEFQKFNQELVKAGVVLGDGRLYPSSQGKRLRFDGKNRTVIDGPFAESKELVGGYWLWQGGPVCPGAQVPQPAPIHRRKLRTPPKTQTTGALNKEL